MELFREDITKEEIEDLELRYFEGEIVVVDSKEQLEDLMSEIKAHKVLGFDTETKPSFKKNAVNKVSLLQLSGKNVAYLIRLLSTGMPTSLIKLFEDPDVIKVGAALRDDIKKLQNYQPFKPAGFVDLQDYVKQFNISGISLKKLAAIIMNFRISKSQRLSNWENDELQMGQQRYAATDAWVCVEIYQKLTRLENSINTRD